jgi:glycosyltransferase involved in cell wall biosynthesis
MVSEHASPLAALGGVDSGGQNVVVAEVAAELGRRGVQVVVHTRRDDPSLPRRVELAPGVVVDHVDAGPAREISKDLLLPYMGRFAAQLARSWREERPDLVHSHFWMSGRAALAAASPLGIPVVHTFHALGVVKRRHQGTKDTSPLERLAEERAVLAAADRIVATCSDEVFELARLGGDQRRIRVVPCGVDVELFRPEGPLAPARRPGFHRLVSVSRLVERKGIGNVVSALPSLPGVELVIAGGPAGGRVFEDPQARRLRTLAGELGVADRVLFVGGLRRDEVPPLLRSADLAVCVPWYEPFGIAPLEAMACGVPVVASTVGGLIDSVVHGVTGRHVPPRRPESIAVAVRELLDAPDQRGELGRGGVERARSRFSWERVADGTLHVYREVVATAEAVPRKAAW